MQQPKAEQTDLSTPKLTPALMKAHDLDESDAAFWNALSPAERYEEYDKALTELRSAVLEENRRGARGLRGAKGRGAALATAVYNAHANHVGLARANERQRERERQMEEEKRLWREKGVAVINGKRWPIADLPPSMIAIQTKFHGPPNSEPSSTAEPTGA